MDQACHSINQGSLEIITIVYLRHKTNEMATRSFYNITLDDRANYDSHYRLYGLLEQLNRTSSPNWNETTSLSVIAIFYDKEDTAKQFEVKTMNTR